MNNNKELKAVIFDLDGTLADTLPLCIESFQTAVEETIGERVSAENITKYFGQTEEGIAKSIAKEKWQACLDSYIRIYTENHHLCGSVFSGIPEILEYLKNNNYKMAMVTGKGEHTVYISLDYYKIRGYFEFVETGSTDGIIKDKCLLKILNNWEIEPYQAVYLGDQPSDITSSHKAGVLPVAVTWASTTDAALLLKENPYKTFDRTEEFMSWIKEITRENKSLLTAKN